MLKLRRNNLAVHQYNFSLYRLLGICLVIIDNCHYFVDIYTFVRVQIYDLHKLISFSNSTRIDSRNPAERQKIFAKFLHKHIRRFVRS